MTTRRYEPPRQGRAGQLFDTLFLVVLVYAVLFAPLVLGLTGGGTTTLEVPEPPTWEGLGQNEQMRAQWEKLGHTPETAAPIVTKRFDYTINPLALLLTAGVIVGYFWLVIRISDREYREVIAEKFDAPPPPAPPAGRR